MNPGFSVLIIETSPDLQACIDHMFDKGSAQLGENTMISSCKNVSSDPAPEYVASSRRLNPTCAILLQRDSDWVGPELGVGTYRICWKINTHKRVNNHSENTGRVVDYTVITQFSFSVSRLLCNICLIVPQNTLDTKT